MPAVTLDEMLVELMRPHGPMLSVCIAPGCTTLTMGGTCVSHDPPVKVTFERGRPYTPGSLEDTEALTVTG